MFIQTKQPESLGNWGDYERYNQHHKNNEIFLSCVKYN